MLLDVQSKSGSGDWIAEGSGTLQVDAAISGAGAWKLVNNANALILFIDAATGLTGPFTIEKGTLAVKANLTSTGILTFRTVSGSRPRIIGLEGTKATFGQ